MHQPLRYWPGPPPFASYGANWSGGGGGFAGGGATGTFGAGQHLAPVNNEQVTTLAEGLICIGSADGRLIPLLPFNANGAAPMAGAEVSPLARGLICILSNGKVVPASQQSAPFSAGQATPAATGLICIWSTDGKVIPMNLCGG